MEPDYSEATIPSSSVLNIFSLPVSLFPKNKDKDEFWIGDKNLYAITRYNPSSKYAMSVFLLSEELKN